MQPGSLSFPSTLSSSKKQLERLSLLPLLLPLLPTRSPGSCPQFSAWFTWPEHLTRGGASRVCSFTSGFSPSTAPQHPVLRLLCVSRPEPRSWSVAGPCCLQLSPADGHGISSIPQRRALQYKVFKSQLSQLSALEGCVQAKPKPLGLAGCGGAEVVRRVWGEVAISFLRRRDTLKGKGRRLRCGRVNRDSPLSRDLAQETLSAHRRHGTQN